MKLLLTRFKQTSRQTLGTLQIYGIHDKIFECTTLELPWKDNQKNVSCIPAGDYRMKSRRSKKYGRHYHILSPDGGEISGRSLILIHHGNYNRDTKGCVLVGKSHTDIDGDGLQDVTSSRLTMERLFGVLSIQHACRLKIVEI